MPYWAKDIKVGFANINAKAEGIESRPAFREAFQRRRCLVPAVSARVTPEVREPLARLAARVQPSEDQNRPDANHAEAQGHASMPHPAQGEAEPGLKETPQGQDIHAVLDVLAPEGAQ